MVNLDESSWVGSRFNFRASDRDGTLLLYNSYTGAFARISKEETPDVEEALSAGFSQFPRGILAELALNGFLVPAERDELRLGDALHQAQFDIADILQLILLPNEKCNFRCKYCAQSFARSRMRRGVIEGVIRLVESRAPALAVLSVGWFGGEPLTAPDVIDELSSRMQEICRRHNIEYSATITTNGYLLSREVADLLFRAQVRRFQITLDGSPEDHDRLRVLADGKTGTFAQILSNLRMLRDRTDDFRVVIRVNFDPGSVGRMDTFLRLLEEEFGADQRFILDFHPVGRWGGPNDSQLQVCGIDDGRSLSLELADRAARKGFDLANLKAQLRPFGSRCYAANPRSFVIGSEGTVYKCTVAFEDPRNKVGVLTENGELLIDEAKHSLWISGGSAADSGCRSCSFRPSCQGGACPLHRMDTGKSPCPSVKLNIEQALRVISSDCVRHADHVTQNAAGMTEEA